MLEWMVLALIPLNDPYYEIKKRCSYFVEVHGQIAETELNLEFKAKTKEEAFKIVNTAHCEEAK